MFELFMYVYSCSALSARFFAVDRALNSYFMIIIMINLYIPVYTNLTTVERVCGTGRPWLYSGLPASYSRDED